MNFYKILIFSCLVIFISCKKDIQETSNTLEFKEYYYPIEDLYDGKVYVYTPVANDTLPSYFWYFFNQGGYLIGTKYDEKLRVEQTLTEEIVGNGTLLHRLQLCDYDLDNPDICQPIQVEIESAAVFPFEMIDSSSVFLNKISWNEREDSTIENQIIKNRHFLGFDKCTWHGKTYDCAKFGIREEIQSGSELIGFQTFKAYTEEHYAKGIGLIYSNKNIENLITLEYQLADTTNMKALENLFLEQRKMQ